MVDLWHRNPANNSLELVKSYGGRCGIFAKISQTRRNVLTVWSVIFKRADKSDRTRSPSLFNPNLLLIAILLFFRCRFTQIHLVPDSRCCQTSQLVSCICFASSSHFNNKQHASSLNVERIKSQDIVGRRFERRNKRIIALLADWTMQ